MAEPTARVPHTGRIILLIVVAVVWVAFAISVAVPHPMVSDEVFYLAMLDALTREGSLFLTNGYEEFQTPALLVRYLIPVDGGLAPQYPSGYAVLAAPAYLVAGARGLVVLNALAAVATLPCVYALAERLTLDRALALNATLIFALASFVVDVPMGIWPHGLAMLFVVAALAAAAAGARAEGRRALVWFALCGASIGLGVHARVDSVLVLPAILFWLLATGSRPFRAALLVIIGALPLLAAAGVLNEIKFGTFNPFSYGRAGEGATSLGGYRVLFPIAIAAVLVAVLSGFGPVRRRLFRPPTMAAGLALIVVAVAVIEPLRQTARSMIEGFLMLVVDFETFRVTDYGIEVQPDGTLRLHGFIKKALVQSMPYMAALVVLVPGAVRGRSGAAVGLCVVTLAIWIAPFALRHWTGNSGASMRYFLPMLAPIAVLSAMAWRELGTGRSRLIGLGASVVTLGIWFARTAGDGYAAIYLVQNPLANPVAVVLLVGGLVWLFVGGPARAVVTSAVKGVFVLALVTAFAGAYVFDVTITQATRAALRQVAQVAAAKVPASSLLISFTPAMADVRFNRPPRMTVRASTFDLWIDADLVRHAFASGRRVFAQDRRIADAIVASGAASGFTLLDETKSVELFEMAPPGEAGSGG